MVNNYKGREKTIFKLAKGFRGRAKNVWRIAVRSVEKALQYAYKSRRLKKRTARRTSIMQVNAAARQHGVRYNELIHGLYHANIGLNRKMLAELARKEPYSFRAIIEESKKAMRLHLLNSATEEASSSEAHGQIEGGVRSPEQR